MSADETYSDSENRADTRAETAAERPTVAPAPPAIPPGPLPACAGDDEVPCVEPVPAASRPSGGALVLSAALGAIVGGLLITVLAAWAFGLVPGTSPLIKLPSSGRIETPRPTETVINIEGGDVNAVAQTVAEKVVPSVVSITVAQRGVDPWTGQEFTQESGSGSGVIIREDGYIITNNHVIDGADRLIVTVGVEDKEAKIVGTDPSTDLAVIKIEGSGYPAIGVGSSTDLVVGQWVMAVGSPFGFERTVTVGVVSALNRSELMQSGNDLTTYTNLIQTDAAINPGNSGGALVNEEGKLVGINSLIQSPSGQVGAAQSSGVGFAIPADFALSVAEQLIETGRATHPIMGVSTETVNETIAAEFDLPVRRGALVRLVQSGSPAEAAGIERGDIIVRIEDREISGVEDVFAVTRSHKVGDTITVEVVRDGERRTFDVTLASDTQ